MNTEATFLLPRGFMQNLNLPIVGNEWKIIEFDEKIVGFREYYAFEYGTGIW